ncbi:MAG: hypothetical protein R2911_15085 [Caldilineaceae bacterium]
MKTTCRTCCAPPSAAVVLSPATAVPTPTQATAQPTIPAPFAVGAVDNNGQMYADALTNGPATCGSPTTTFPHMTAPGVNVKTTVLVSILADRHLASAPVSVALALLLTAYPSATAAQQQAALLAAAWTWARPASITTLVTAGWTYWPLTTGWSTMAAIKTPP